MSIEKNYRPEDYAKAMSETFGLMRAFDLACEGCGQHRTGKPHYFWCGVREALRGEAEAIQRKKREIEESARKQKEALLRSRVDSVVSHINTLGYNAVPDYTANRVIVGLSSNG